MLQFALISLIPGLLRKLQDAADPEFDSYEKSMVMPMSLKTSERKSCMLSVSGQATRAYGWQCYLIWVSRCSCRYCSVLFVPSIFGMGR